MFKVEAKQQDVVIAGCPNKNMTVGDKLQLRCALAALQPSISYRWKRVDGTLNFRAETPGAGILLIREVTVEDSGTYECQAYNTVTNQIVGWGRVTVTIQGNKSEMIPTIYYTSTRILML